MALFGKEPAVIIGAIAEVIKAIFPMLIIFGLIHWSADQLAQVMIVVGVVVGALNVILTRSQVVPTETANAQIRTAVTMPPDSTLKQVIAEHKKEQKAEDKANAGN